MERGLLAQPRPLDLDEQEYLDANLGARPDELPDEFPDDDLAGAIRQYGATRRARARPVFEALPFVRFFKGSEQGASIAEDGSSRRRTRLAIPKFWNSGDKALPWRRSANEWGVPAGNRRQLKGQRDIGFQVRYVDPSDGTLSSKRKVEHLQFTSFR